METALNGKIKEMREIRGVWLIRANAQTIP